MNFIVEFLAYTISFTLIITILYAALVSLNTEIPVKALIIFTILSVIYGILKYRQVPFNRIMARTFLLIVMTLIITIIYLLIKDKNDKENEVKSPALLVIAILIVLIILFSIRTILFDEIRGFWTYGNN